MFKVGDKVRSGFGIGTVIEVKEYPTGPTVIIKTDERGWEVHTSPEKVQLIGASL